MGSLYRKVKVIAANATNKLIAPVANALYSLVLIRNQGIDFWGEFVVPLLIVNISYQVVAWGNRDYLLKYFSEKPAEINSTWTSNLIARLIILVLCVFTFLIASPFSGIINLWTVVWIVATFLSRAFNVLILFEKKFSVSSWLEGITAVLVLAVIFIFRKEISLAELIMLISLSLLLKALCLSFFFRGYFSSSASWQKGKKTLQESLGFFLPAVTGFLQNRVDIYLVALLMPKDALGVYQILMNLMLITHNSIGFALGPFIKNMYRVTDKTFNKVNKLMTAYGSLFCLVSAVVIYLITSYYYKLSIDTAIFTLILIQMVPFANYQLKIYRLFKLNKAYSVVWINLFLVVIYLPLTFLLIPAFGLKGALASNLINQWVALLVIHFTTKYYFNKTSISTQR